MEFPPVPAATLERLAEWQRQFARAFAETSIRPAVEAASKAIAEFTSSTQRCDWQGVSDLSDGPIVGVDFGYEPVPVVVLPCQYGKTHTLNVTLTDSMRNVFTWVDAHIRARQDATVSRLADELGLPEYVARRHFDAVQHVLEDAGIGDGYGRLTLPQPVRLPVPWPCAPR